MFKQQNLGHTWLTKIYENVFHLYHFSFLMWLLENWELPTCVSLYSMDSRVGDSQISQICSRNAGCHSSMKPFPTQGLLKVIVSQEAWSPAAWEDTLSHTAESVCVCPCTGQAAFKDVLLGDTPSLITKKKKKILKWESHKMNKYKCLTELLTPAAPAWGIKISPESTYL